ncbi:MAG: vWA domain-containing protein [Bdellovibrionota bacterium]
MMQRSTDERGAVMLLLLIISFTALTLIGLAIDSGNLYTSSMLLQKAVDAGALAAAKKIAVTGKQVQTDPATKDAFIAEVKRVAESMIDANMSIRKKKTEYGANLPGDPLRYSIPDPDLINDIVEIKASWSVSLLFLRFLPGYGDKRTIYANAKAQVQRSMVSLLLDSSGSMLCPADGSDCGCAPLCKGAIKIDRLKDAVALFASQFNSNRDLLHVAYFSLGAFTALPMVSTGGFSLNALEYALNNMLIVGGTNQCDGLLMGWNATRDAVHVQGDRSNVAYVLFSDGAPTAGRFFFAHPTSLPSNDVFGLPNLDHDYYNWSVNYRNPADPAPLDQRPTMPLIPGVMVLARAGMVPYNWNLGNPPSPDNGNPDSRVACSQKNPLDPSAPFVSCLSDYGFYDFTGSRVWGANVPFQNYREQYYNCAIAMSDALRDDGGIVYTVGLGSPAPLGTDPYQSAGDDTSRKDEFFLRLADDLRYGDLPNPFPNEFATYVPPPDTSHLNHGTYLALDNAMNLNQTFLQLYDKIVRKVKTVQLIR